MSEKYALNTINDLPNDRQRDLELPDPDAQLVPLERLEERICELAAHLAAGTCRFLELVAEFDARRGWECWDLPSCAAWLAWKCQVAPGTAREQVRVARALADLPVIHAEFAAGRMSYAKARALTRIATAATETDLAEITGPMTAAQCERFVAAHRTASDAAELANRATRRVSVHVREDGWVAINVRLPAADAAVVLQALRAAAGDCEHPHRAHGDPAEDGGQTPHTSPSADGVPAETYANDAASEESGGGARAARGTATCRASLADALVEVAGVYLSGKVTRASNPDIYQVIVHVGPEALSAGPGASDPSVTPSAVRGVSAETHPTTGRQPRATSPRKHTRTTGRQPRAASPRKRLASGLGARRRALRSGQPGTRRTRGAAISTTARPSARRPRRPLPATRPCPGCCTIMTAICLTLGDGTGGPPRRCAAPSANATGAVVSSPAVAPGEPTSIT